MGVVFLVCTTFRVLDAIFLLAKLFNASEVLILLGVVLLLVGVAFFV